MVIELSIFVVFRDLVLVRVVMGGWFRVCFKVVFVKVSGLGSDKYFMIYVFLDSGLDIIFCLRSLVEELSFESEFINFIFLIVNY